MSCSVAAVDSAVVVKDLQFSGLCFTGSNMTEKEIGEIP